MENNYVRLIGTETELREKACETWKQIRRALCFAVRDARAQEPFSLLFMESEAKVEVSSVCSPSCITVAFDPKPPCLIVTGCQRDIIIHFKIGGEGVLGLEWMGVPVSVSSLIHFVTQNAFRG